MLLEIKISAVGYPPQLSPAKWEEILDVGGGLAVMGQLFRGMLPGPDVFRLQPQFQQPLLAELYPVFIPIHVGPRCTEEFQLHLLELPGPENEVARGDFISKGFTDLADAKWDLLTGCAHYILEIDENPLGCFRPEVHFRFCIFGHTLKGLVTSG